MKFWNERFLNAVDGRSRNAKIITQRQPLPSTNSFVSMHFKLNENESQLVYQVNPWPSIARALSRSLAVFCAFILTCNRTLSSNDTQSVHTRWHGSRWWNVHRFLLALFRPESLICTHSHWSESSQREKLEYLCIWLLSASSWLAPTTSFSTHSQSCNSKRIRFSFFSAWRKKKTCSNVCVCVNAFRSIRSIKERFESKTYIFY